MRKLSDQNIVDAIAHYRSGKSLAEVAAVFKVSRQSMHDLLKRRIKLRPQKRYAADNHFFRGGKKANAKAHDIFESALNARRVERKTVCEQCGHSGRF